MYTVCHETVVPVVDEAESLSKPGDDTLDDSEYFGWRSIAENDSCVTEPHNHSLTQVPRILPAGYAHSPDGIPDNFIKQKIIQMRPLCHNYVFVSFVS
ncbi:hypothetical protein TNCV_4213571 [Trichonephila clavipes]|nr:hypothetical protein TNCV_4213571 [Trichonephila clavipes]